MRAVVCERLGDPTASGQEAPLRLSLDRPEPVISERNVLIRIAAASLNFADALQVQGSYQEKPKLPFIPGSECSGVVVGVGSGVTAVQVGDKVVAVTQGGCLAEQVCVNESAVFKLPGGTDLEAAAGLPVAFGTSYLALVQRARIAAHQTVLVLGAGGGVGTAAVQIAKAVGCRVIAVARGEAKLAALRALQADVCIDGAATTQPLSKAIKAVAPKGVDCVYDPVGGDAFKEALRCVAWGGQLCIVGFASGAVPQLPANIALVKNLTVHGIYWGAHMWHRPAVLQKGMEQLLLWLREGRIKVQVSDRLPLEQFQTAFRLLLQRQAVGKVLLLPQARAARL